MLRSKVSAGGNAGYIRHQASFTDEQSRIGFIRKQDADTMLLTSEEPEECTLEPDFDGDLGGGRVDWASNP